MDANRFDNWTRNRAKRLSRRDALKLAAGGSATAALTSISPALAQTTCTVTLHAQTVAGSSESTAYDGALRYTVASDGSLSQATFTPTGGSALAVSGAITGRSVDFLIQLTANTSLVLSGTADQKSGCPTNLGGVLAGPQPSDIGTWQGAGGSSSSAPVTNSGQTSGSSSSGTGSTGGTSCQSPSFACGPNCCPSGATCADTNQGICACPANTTQCGLTCVQNCPSGQTLDFDSCTCSQSQSACIANQRACQNHEDCCSGYCGGGTCFDCAGIVCGTFGCVDPSKDSQNCGDCGITCTYPRSCVNGICACAPDQTPCIDHSECCSQLCFVNTCVTCSNVTAVDGTPHTFCAAGSCVDLRNDIDNCGACGNVCPAPSGSAVCDAGVCHDINNDADYCGFSPKVCPSGQICRFGQCTNP